MSTRHIYDRQAETYDSTRNASPSVLGPLRDALAGAPGPELLDVGGGTGNYAAALREEGWEPLVVDLNGAMLAHAAAKGLPTLRGDATALPIGDERVDAVMLVSMLHHVPDWRAALAEARRVMRPGGRLAVMGWTLEHMEEVTWVSHYFPSMDGPLLEQHRRMGELQAELSGARVLPVEFSDLEDGSMAALQHHPRLMLDPEWRRQTSYFEQLAERYPEELEKGLARLCADLDAGIDPNGRIAAGRARWGDAAVVAWTKPAARS